MSEATIEHRSNRRVMTIDLTSSKIPASLADAECLRLVRRELAAEKADQLILIKDFKKVYSAETIALLRELDAVAADAKARLPASVDTAARCKDCIPRLAELVSKAATVLDQDPVAAYFILIEGYYSTVPDKLGCRQTLENYRKLIAPAIAALERSKVISHAKTVGDAIEAYHTLFKPWAIPAFISSEIDQSVPADAELVDKYKVGSSLIRIYRIPGQAELFYHITAPEFLVHEDENRLIQAAFDEINRQEAKILDPKKARDHFYDLGRKQLAARGIRGQRLDELSDIIARYSAGYGILEVLLTDDGLQDIFVDSPGNQPVYVYHGDHEECITNISLSDGDLEKLAARFRSISGRPFDESSPVLHAELKDLGIRIAALCPPATFGGIAFAFRRSRPRPWTLPQFVNVGMMDAATAGLLSFLVDSQASILVTGSRGSGKSSLLAALLAQTATNFRIIVIEDTPELPVDDLQAAGFKIQHIRTKPSFGQKGENDYELSAEDALRTALRLGESVLVIGEVRGPEAKALFEAMRIGAAGNVVMGTIHGSSAYDTWDRIVNDLGVPSTSFKATDVVVSCAALRKQHSTSRERKLTAVTEVGKEWREDPHHEGGFSHLTSYSPERDRWQLAVKDSKLLSALAEKRGMALQEVLNDITYRGRLMQLIVDASRRHSAPALLEIERVTEASKRYRALLEQSNYAEALKGMEAWLDDVGQKTVH